MVENPVKHRITKSRKNLDKQDKIDLEKPNAHYVEKGIIMTPNAHYVKK